MSSKTYPFKSILNGALRRNRILLKLIASFILPAVVIILIISIFFSIIYSNESMKDINSNSLLTLSNTSASFKNTIDSAKQTAYQIYRNVIPLYYINPTNEEKSRAVAYINNVIISSPQLYSVYIVVDHKIVLDFGGSPLFEESSKEISSFINKSSTFKPTPRQIVNNNGVLSLITTIYSKDFSEEFGDYVVLNFTPNNLFTQVSGEFLQQGQSMIITDWAGNIIAHNNREMFSRNISTEHYFEKIKASKASHGSIKTYIDYNYSIVNYLFADDNSYIIIFTSDYKSYFAKTMKTRNTIIYFCLLTLFLLALISVFLSYRIYTPINNIFSNIRNLLGNEYSHESVSKEEKQITGLIRYC